MTSSLAARMCSVLLLLPRVRTAIAAVCTLEQGRGPLAGLLYMRYEKEQPRISSCNETAKLSKSSPCNAFGRTALEL